MNIQHLRAWTVACHRKNAACDIDLIGEITSLMMLELLEYLLCIFGVIWQRSVIGVNVFHFADEEKRFGAIVHAINSQYFDEQPRVAGLMENRAALTLTLN